MPVVTEPASIRANMPGTVLAASILLYIGGGLTVVYALAGLGSGPLRAAGYTVYGLMYVGLGWAVGHRKRWARRVVLVLCGIGVLLAVLRFIGGGIGTGVSSLAWPVVYAVLLMTDSARAWFAAR
jgi:hypothetical protein